ncbi:MAG: CBASS cGAMP-activated phospholipase [Pirellulaceae bacterium]
MNNQKTSHSSRFQILSLDGGGIKGVYSAAVLAKLEEDLGTNVVDHFDLIAGTSTGGIIALGLGIGVKPREMVQFYVQEGAVIFKKRGWFPFRSLWRARYPQKPITRALQKCLGDKRLADSSKRLVIPSYNLDRDEVYLFKTPHHPRLTRDWKEPLWKVALATGAAPTFFPACQHVDHIRLVDGGVWANNPTMVAIAEAVSMLGIPLDAISVLSLGTTNAVANRKNNLDRGGLWQWRKTAIDIVLRAQSHGVQAQAQHLIGKERAVRLDSIVPDGLFALDKLSEQRLLSEAAHASRSFSPTFTQAFAAHIAAPFEPLQPSNNNGNLPTHHLESQQLTFSPINLEHNSK